MRSLRIRLLLGMLICFLWIPAVSALAKTELPDLERTGSLSVTIRDSKGPVGGGSLKLYKVADAKEEDGDYFFELTEAFAHCGYDVRGMETERLSKGTLAKEMNAWASKNFITAEVLTVGADGICRADKLSLGLYLVAQNEAPGNYTTINPFLVTIPLTEEDTLIYDVDASPKVGTIAKKPDKPPTEPPTTPSEPPEEPPLIPFTGQLWWPIPILAAAGLLLIMLGWKRRCDSE